MTSLLVFFHASKVVSLTQVKRFNLSHIFICAFCLTACQEHWHSSIHSPSTLNVITHIYHDQTTQVCVK